MVKIEFHVHTRYSGDSLLRLRRLYRTLRAHGIDWVAITDHNTAEGALAFRRRYDGHRIRVIVGEEIMTTEGEIIGLFLKETIPSGMTPEATVAAIEAQGGLVYVPHPYDEKRAETVLRASALARLGDRVHLIERYNGRNVSPAYEAKQASIALCVPALPVVGSDAHSAPELGRNYMIAEPFSSPEELLAALEDADAVTAPCHPAAHRLTRWAKLLGWIKKGDFRALSRALHRRRNRTV